MSSFLLLVNPIICPMVQEAHIDQVIRLGKSIMACRKHWSCRLNAIPTLSCCILGFLIGDWFYGFSDNLELVPISAIDFVSINGLPIPLFGVPPKDLDTIKIRSRNKIVDGWHRVSFKIVQNLSRPSRFVNGSIVQEDSPFLSKHPCCKPIDKVFKVSRSQVLAFDHCVMNQSSTCRYCSTYGNVFLLAVFAVLDEWVSCLSPMMSTILVSAKGAFVNLHKFKASIHNIEHFLF